MKKSVGTKILLVFSLSIMITLSTCSSDNDVRVEFPQPATIRSVDGLLQTTMQVLIATNTIKDRATGKFASIETPTYNGTLIGPTLKVKPGDTIKIDLVNDLPRNPTVQRMGGFPHDPYTTNLHTHGLAVSPQGISDNIFRLMEPGTISPIEIAIPSDHECGTFWYHPHKHGSVSFQFFGGMSGFLIIEGCEDGLETVPEIADAKDLLLGLQVIRTDADGKVPYVNQEAPQFSSDLEATNGLWALFQNSKLYMTTNGVTNPVITMQPGEVQRWRILNAASGVTLALALQAHELNVIANDGVTVANMVSLGTDTAYVMGAGNRVDVLIKAGEPGTYLLQALDPSTPRSVSPSGVSPAPRISRIGSDFPNFTYPVTLATVRVIGYSMDMKLPTEPLPVPERLPSVDEMMSATPDVVRNIAFEICGQRGQQQQPENRLPSCGWYFNLYDAEFWGGTPFTSLPMARDADDTGVSNPTPTPEMPRVDYQKGGLFNADEALFDNMFVGNIEEWTIFNRTNSDHSFHIHTNPFLLTHINGETLQTPEWQDTLLVPAATGGQGNINDATFGSITFRIWYDPRFTGSIVFHCHILTHEDVGMMQRLDLLEPP